MRIWKRVVAALVVGLLIGGAAGAIAGMRLGASAIVSHWVITNANNTEEMVQILEHWHAGRGADVRSSLETHLNRHAFGLMPSSWDQASISDLARARAVEAAGHARAYREAHAFAATTALDREVERFLERQ